jgi:hypothetical protein
MKIEKKGANIQEEDTRAPERASPLFSLQGTYFLSITLGTYHKRYTAVTREEIFSFFFFFLSGLYKCLGQTFQYKLFFVLFYFFILGHFPCVGSASCCEGREQRQPTTYHTLFCIVFVLFISKRKERKNNKSPIFSNILCVCLSYIFGFHHHRLSPYIRHIRGEKGRSYANEI